MINNTGTFNYDQVRTLCRRAPNQDIFTLDMLFIPVNLDQLHWILIVAFMQDHRIQAYDSLGSDHTNLCNAVEQYLQHEHQHLHNNPLPDQWEIIGSTPGVPIQPNGYDCGVYVCNFVARLLHGVPLPDLDPAEITQYSRWIAWALALRCIPQPHRT